MSEAQKERRSGWYTFARVVAFFATHTIFPVKYHDVERMSEREGSFIIIANHASMLDPVAIANAVKKREITFMGKKELMKNKLLARIFTGMHMIVVDRHNSDMRAMRACVSALRKGEILGIFPEGTRHHEGVMEQMESGAALITLQSKAPLVPVLITPKIKAFRRTHIYVGEPIDYTDLLEQGVSNETAAALTERIRATYRTMLESCE